MERIVDVCFHDGIFIVWTNKNIYREMKSIELLRIKSLCVQLLKKWKV